MKSVIELFEMITKIPRCSFKAEKMKDFLIDFAQNMQFGVEVDNAGNILCRKGNPKVCLQSHYDMVCLGDAPSIELVRDKNILRAKNSTLGADNGMGVAIMLYCMQKYDNLEVLFTADEEVGLIGASNLNLEIYSENILNIDGEDEKEIYIGCAGGVDILAKLDLEYENLCADEVVYRVVVDDLPGGHSGVDIDKNIPSAIKLLSKYLVENNCELLDIKGGERRNSIPKRAEALVTSRMDLKSEKNIKVETLNSENLRKIKNSVKILNSLYAFAHGVRSYDKKMCIPLLSINLGVVSVENGVLNVISSARGMNDEDMNDLVSQTKSFFKLSGFNVELGTSHNAWTPNPGDFTYRLRDIMKKHIDDVSLKAIHAGLECGILLAKQKKGKEAVAIGPDIRNPHSLREECDLDSVERIKQIIEEVICH